VPNKPKSFRTLAHAAQPRSNPDPSASQSALPPPTNSYTVPTGGFDGVGNILASQDSIMGNWTYQYDVLNRLLTGSASSGPDTNKNACWSYTRGPHGQVFVRGVEDDFGNRTIESVQTGACSTAGTFASTMVFNAQNQLSGVIAPGGSSQSPPSLLYDSAGDVTSDSSTGNQYVYDAEGRICAFQTPSGLGGTIMMGYLYNADGIRVAKGTITTMTCDPATNGFTMTGNNTGTYVLGQGGEELTQLSGSGAWQRTNVFGGGKQLATYDSLGLHFQITDPLGTRRMQTNDNGQPETDIQSLPFGDGLVIATDQYAPATADDATPLHFTGKERDAESGNDYFGARYYSSSMGRFMSPDWSAKYEPVPYAKLDNPQTLNLYAYMRNNPLGGVDKDGHSPDWWQKLRNGVAGNGLKTDAELAPKPGQFTVTLNSRAANIPGGGILHAAGADHEWVSTSDGKSVGMGAAKNGGQIPDKNGESSPDKPGAPTQLVDESGDKPTTTHTFTNVDKGAIDSYLTPGKATGPWIPMMNDCNTWAENAIGQSTPHDAYDRNSDTMVHNAVVYSDGSIHQVNPQ
jgi:RHS repeat-associated protein